MEVSESREEKETRQEYDSVCSKLNMDQDSMKSAWSSYCDVHAYYALEVREACVGVVVELVEGVAAIASINDNV